MEDEEVRNKTIDPIFEHLRTQDLAIQNLRNDMQPVIEIIENLRGFSDFCYRWGRRLNIALRWLATVGPALALLWQWLSDPTRAWLKSKGY